MRSGTLRLRHEALADLTTDELHSMPGASGIPCHVAGTIRCDTMLTYTKLPSGCMCTGMYPSLNIPCTTPVTPVTTVVNTTGC